ncbi:hypothetical protein [Brevibacillus migulae]|uniref:hypothetical protein n=1 Tax=Brevibacillus migulae TaxID=1644114 RepID=UPI00106E8AE7|nr:hypothetical protein [Brevibacillus migulae]
MAAIIAFFPHEDEAMRFIRQSALETTIHSITFLNSAKSSNADDFQATSLSDTLYSQGFHAEQCDNCVRALDGGQVAVLLECDDAADMLVALHSHGIRDYHMA